jgi:hypothetical protein
MARTNLYKCLRLQESCESHLPDWVQDQVARLATPSHGVRQIAGPLTEGPGPTSRPGSLPAPRVACRYSPVGFDRQQHLTPQNMNHAVAEQPKLFRFKYADHRYTGDRVSTHFKRNNALVCWVTARFNHGYTRSM